MLEYLGQGALLGLAAGVAPGPLLVLVVTETLRHGTFSGVKVAAAPLVTDIPIIALALGVLPRLPMAEAVMGGVSLAGAAFIVHLACESLRTRGITLDPAAARSTAFRRGLLTNWLNPHPWVFWVGVGAPIIYRAGREGWAPAAAFVGSFFLLIVGSKVVLAVIAGRCRDLLSTAAYVWIVRALGLALAFFGLLLARDGLRLLGWMG